MNLSWSKTLCSSIGSALIGPSGALIGSTVGGFLGILLPGPIGFVTGVISNLATDAIEKSGRAVVDQLTPPERQHINHDLQTAFRDAFREAVYDLGGETCFTRVWAEKIRDVPTAQIYPLTSQANRLWQNKDPLADQVCHFFKSMEQALAEQRLLPLNPPLDQPAADVRRYLEAETPQALADAFFDQVLAPFLAEYGSLLAEVPDLKIHLQHYLLDRVLLHLGEFLKSRDRAWRAFNRLMLEGVRAEVRQVSEGQTEILAKLDAMVAQPDGQAMADWADGLAELVSATGRIEKQMDEGFEAVLDRVATQHAEVVAHLGQLMLVTERIETKVDRVLRILEDGQYVIEGASVVALDAPPAPGEPPFKGLQHFDAVDAEWFYGRELLTARLAGRLRQPASPSPEKTASKSVGEGRFLAIIGASGSGKSSVVRAGLIPAFQRGDVLADGTFPPIDSASWLLHVITPTAHPLEALAASLTRDMESVTAASTLVSDMARDPHSLNLAVRKLLSRDDMTAQRDSNHLWLIVDQFEELFTLCRNSAERRAFVDNLLTAAGLSSEADGPQSGGPLTIVITLRADFYGHCAQFDNLRSALAQHQEFIGPMTADELRRAIEQPARRGEWEFERGLTDLILDDVGHEPGALPLLSHALLETWKRRRDRTMTLESYAESGGVRGAIAKTAETVYHQQLTPEQQIIARNIFLRLTESGEGTQDTRRRVALSELVPNPADVPAVDAVIQALADARLITTGEGTAEVAHEALIREWPTLRRWLDEDRQGLRIHHQLTEDAGEWVTLKRDVGALYRGARLAEAGEWAAAHPDQINILEREFLDQSQALVEAEAREREAQRQHELAVAQALAETQRQRAEEQAQATDRLRQRNRIITAVGIVAILAAITAIFFGAQSDTTARNNASLAATNAAIASDKVAIAATAQAASAQAIEQKNEALRQTQLALAGKLAAQAMSHLDDQLDLAMLLSIEGYRITDTLQSRGSLLTAAHYNPRLIRFLQGHVDVASSVAFSPDGKLVASGSRDHAILMWDTASGQMFGQPLLDHTQGVNSIAFSPDGKRLVSGSSDNTLRLWDVASSQPIGQPWTGHTASIWSVVFSPDGQTVASGSEDNTIILWSATTGQPLRRPLPGHTDTVYSVAFSPDGKTLASGSIDKSIILWNVTTGQPITQPLTGHTGAVESVAFSPDGKLLASGSYDSNVRLWDAATGQPIAQPLKAHTGIVNSVTFSPDGKFLASADTVGVINFWSVATYQLYGQIRTGQTGGIWSIAFSPDSKTLAAASVNGPILLWDLTGGQLFDPTLRGHTDGVTGIFFNPDGQSLASSGLDGQLINWSRQGGQSISSQSLKAYTGTLMNTAFSPDGKLLASTNISGVIRLWNVATGQPIGQPLSGHTGIVWDAEFSPDGKQLASAGDDKTIRLWDVATGQSIGQPLTGHTGLVQSVAFSPDGRTLASASYDDSIILWDVATAQPITQPLRGHYAGVASVAFSPDGKRLASGGIDSTVVLWDVATGEALGQPLRGHTGSVMSVAFSPDGRTLASGSEDKTVRLWDVATGQPIGQPLTGHLNWVLTVAFSPDGHTLASGSSDRTIILWNLDPQAWQALACRRAGRSFTDQEWTLYFPDEAYRTTCP